MHSFLGTVQMRPPLHTASLLGNEEDVARLLALGADVEEVDFVSCGFNFNLNSNAWKTCWL